ncbi:MAG: DNA repair protein RecO [Alistipes sp.]|nr:DNA repair protein RecO [Alistipes sp.]
MKSYKARGIVLNTIKYGDTSMVAQLLTDRYGRQSYMIQGVRSSRGKGSKMAHFQPMFALDFEGLTSSKSELHRMREIHNGILLRSTPYDVRKSTIALFMAEVLYRLIGESEENPELFEFVWGSVEALDMLEEGVANFHLWFLANISRFLGFSPGNEYQAGCWFDMREGLFTQIMPLHDEVCPPEAAHLLARLLACRVESLGEIALNRSQRVEMLTLLVSYYSIHLDSIRRVESIRILQEVF